jgi:hypothetical protein
MRNPMMNHSRDRPDHPRREPTLDTWLALVASSPWKPAAVSILFTGPPNRPRHAAAGLQEGSASIAVAIVICARVQDPSIRVALPMLDAVLINRCGPCGQETYYDHNTPAAPATRCVRPHHFHSLVRRLPDLRARVKNCARHACISWPHEQLRSVSGRSPRSTMSDLEPNGSDGILAQGIEGTQALLTSS